MSDSEVSTPININISSKDKQNSKDEYNEFKKYIIINNIALQKEVKKANNNIKSLESQLQKQEESEDKYEIQINYLKGFLQNLYELRNDYNNVSKKTQEKLKIVQDLHKKNKNLYYEIYCLLIIINTFTIVTPLYYINVYVLFLQTFTSLTIPFCFYKIKEKYLFIKQLSKNSTTKFQELTLHINNIENQIKKTEDTCISLDNWIHKS